MDPAGARESGAAIAPAPPVSVIPHTWMGASPARRILSASAGVSASPPTSGRTQLDRSAPTDSLASRSARAIVGTTNIMAIRWRCTHSRVRTGSKDGPTTTRVPPWLKVSSVVPLKPPMWLAGAHTPTTDDVGA